MWAIIASLIIGAVGLLIFLIERYLQRHRSLWASKGIHVFQNDLTLLQLFRGKFPGDFDLAHYKELEKEGLPYGGRSEMGTPVFVARDMELIKSIFVKDFDSFVDRRHFGDDPIFSKSMFFMEGQAWKNMRNSLSPTFSSGKIRRMFEQFDSSGQKLFDYVKLQCPKASPKGYDVNLDEMLRRYTVDVIGSVAFGMETKALVQKDSDFLKYAAKASNFFNFRIILLMSLPKLAKLLKIQLVDAETSNFFKSIIISAIRMRESTGEKRNDFLQLLLEARDASRKEKIDLKSSEDVSVDISDAVVISQAFTFFFAGFESVTNVLRNMMYLLSANPEVQDRLRAEIKQKVRLANGQVTYDSVSTMEYLDMVVSETLRFIPGGTRLERKCMRDYQIPGTNDVIPKDSIVIIPTIGIHKDEQFYLNPHEFNPEHFSSEQKAARNPFSYLSFGQGPRNCIGARFALMEVKAAAAHILMKFEIQPSDKFPLPLKWEKVLGIDTSRKDTLVRLTPVDD